MTNKYRSWQGKYARIIYSKLSNFNTIAEHFDRRPLSSEYLTWGKVAGKAVFEFNKSAEELHRID